jgi:hypothetical protein
MTFTALIAVCALFGVLFFVAAIRRLRRRRVLGGMAHGAAALIFFLAAVCAVLIGTNLRSYQRLAYEQPAGELQLTKGGDRQFDAVLTYPDGQHSSFPLRGDEWQVDARVLKWHAFANLVGFDAAYRLPWLDALYGSATFLPMADGALYEIKVSQSGLVARPLNQAAREAVGSWH